MTTGLVLVTHGDTAATLLAEARIILDEALDDVRCVRFDQTTDAADAAPRIETAIREADRGHGVLVLTDLIGASPANHVAAALERFDAVMVTGVNLGMLVCAWSNRGLTLGALARKAVECGRRSVKIFQQ
ncbi:MAG: hypothetical protein P8Y54_13655 [Xanthomonadales bacterium]